MKDHPMKAEGTNIRKTERAGSKSEGIKTRKEGVMLEPVNHETAARPFSIHRTYVGGENENALYLHWHPEAEFFFLEEGEICFCVEEQSYMLRSGDAVFVPPGLTHHAVKAPGMACRYSALVFSLEWLSGYSREVGNLYVNTLLNHRREAIRLFRSLNQADGEMLGFLSHFRTYADLQIQSYELRLLGEVMICVQEIYGKVAREAGDHEKWDSARIGVRRSIDYMMMHYSETITLEALVKSSGYSESHFCHRFKTVTGYTPFAYLNRIRVIKAAELLVSTPGKITEIAGNCGFENISYFNRVFRKQMGKTPGKYRSDTAW